MSTNYLQNTRKISWQKRFKKAIVTNVKRRARIGNYWYWQKPTELEEGVDIASLICPLRYDVILRRDFFSFYAAHRDLYKSDFDAFANLVRQTSYYTMHEKSEAIRCGNLELAADSERLWSEVVSRIHEIVALYESVVNSGFDRHFPITLKTAENILPPTTDNLTSPTGKVISARYFVADGCHRLALLMAMGYTVLPPDYFQVQCFREFSPFDSTSLLAPGLPIEPSTYFTFLSSYYCAPLVFENRDDFLRYIRDNKPEFLQEVLSVIRVDGFDTDSSTGNGKTHSSL